MFFKLIKIKLVSAKNLCLKGISNKIDDSSGSVGRRYARTDEIAVPYCITVDFDSLIEPQSVTIRERDSMEQIRVPVRTKAQKFNIYFIIY